MFPHVRLARSRLPFADDTIEQYTSRYPKLIEALWTTKDFSNSHKKLV